MSCSVAGFLLIGASVLAADAWLTHLVGYQMGVILFIAETSLVGVCLLESGDK
jgi:hypothetical protein